MNSSSPGSGVTIVGSANIDIVYGVERIPGPGETLLASSAARYPGGKGLNQTVAAARAGAPTTFIGAVGHDEFGEELLATLTDDQIDTSLLRRSTRATGQAFIMVDANAENAIVVSPGANADVTALTDSDRACLQSTGVLLMQLEIPLDTVREAAAVAHAARATVMLNAAPAHALPAQLLADLDVLIVNEHEACLIGASDDLATASATLAALVPRVIVTLGAAGCALYEDGAEVGRVAAPRVAAVDTTGAGDTFCGAFAAAISDGAAYGDAAEFATHAAALSVQALGAVPSIPVRAAIEEARA
ncbi:ribokinase [Lacisediminihabitans changchengi]|uniref:Ribokinase n=1 Tax=Lacisediminihabitans changchengi TaxID=2787634 RepID=A0A934SSZ7_9MICO|nr:ribokinase [Lacisediminihabitans changchengi]MBK4347564.1 ribokinase [Lacisediminihabitans changchengi]